MTTLNDFMTLPPIMYPAHSEKYGQGSKSIVKVTLPGHGDVGVGCGRDIPMLCHSCGETYTVSSSCMKRECPNCYEKWASREGKISAYRLWLGASHIARGKPYKKGYRLMHVVVSLPSGEGSRSRAIEISKRHGIQGALMVWHPFRHDDERQYVPDGYDHYHVIGQSHGDILPGGLPADGDAIFKVVPDAIRHDFRGFQRLKEVRRCVKYLLTHCGIQRGRHALTWWGTLSYNSLSNKKLDEYFPDVMNKAREFRPRCPVCGSYDVEPLYMMDYTTYPGDCVSVGANYLGS